MKSLIPCTDFICCWISLSLPSFTRHGVFCTVSNSSSEFFFWCGFLASHLFCSAATALLNFVAISSSILSSMKYACSSDGPIVPSWVRVICLNSSLQMAQMPLVWRTSGMSVACSGHYCQLVSVQSVCFACLHVAVMNGILHWWWYLVFGSNASNTLVAVLGWPPFSLMRPCSLFIIHALSVCWAPLVNLCSQLLTSVSSNGIAMVDFSLALLRNSQR